MKIIIFLILNLLVFTGNVSASKKIIDRSFQKNENLPFNQSITIKNTEKYSQEIMVSENNLGMIDLLISTKDLDDDGIIFRIKESSQENWEYENFYDAQFFTKGLFYSFGFKPFLNSENRKYLIEVELVDPNQNNEAKIYLLENQDLAWRAAVDESFSKILKENFGNEFQEKLQTQKTFFDFWQLLLLANFGALLYVIFIFPKKEK